ncbi:hypothetical protein [Gandjariella thermophila]|uniref:Serine protease n=1 Tax=Gandjariella thermophila TaxID=1931992 RepID=A0A4D4IZ12_9PSEU|nr:hypothetical protein [Gandjariella thermophila]GDY29491.1 hypothetical protein GTS_11240 [Gandjariella thermophila]
MTSPDETVRAAIRPVKKRVEDELLALPGVVAVDIGEQVTGGARTGRAAIVVTVLRKRHELDVPTEHLIPREVAGVPVDVVEDAVVLHRALLTEGFPPPAAQGAERHDVVIGGISAGPARSVLLVPPQAPRQGEYVIVGTLGALVTDRAGAGDVLALTTFHVACVDDAWQVGDEMLHPSRVDGGRCARDVVATLARAALSGSVDAAAVLLRPGRPYRPVITEVGPVAGTANPTLGTLVRKRGRATGLTVARVASLDATLSVDYGDGLGVRTLRDQVRVESAGGRFGDYGDSGAVLVDADNRIVGLYFAGNGSGSAGYANPIGKVLDQLDVDVLTC